MDHFFKSLLRISAAAAIVATILLMQNNTFAVQLGGAGTSYPEKVPGILTTTQTLEVDTGRTKLRSVDYLWPANQGASNTYLKNSSSGILTWETASAIATPEGVNGSVQYNNSGLMGGSANLLWINASNRLLVNTAEASNSETLGVGGRVTLQQVEAPASTENKLYNVGGALIWNGIDLTSGGALPSGTSGQTLRHSGAAWVANSFLYNNGTSVGIGTAETLSVLDVNGDVRLMQMAAPSPYTDKLYNVGGNLYWNNISLSSGGSLPSPGTAGNLLIDSSAAWDSRPMSGDITITATGVTTISANAVTTAEIQDGSITLPKIASSLVLPVASGGTNKSSWTQYALIYPDTTTSFAQLALGTSTQVLHGNASGAPTWSQISLDTDTTGVLPVVRGGTSVGTFTQYGLVYASTTASLTATTAGATGKLLKGVTSGAPVWSTLYYPDTYTRYALVYASTTSSLAATAVGTSGSVLKGISSSAPVWGQVSLSTDTTGILPIAKGGTNNSIYTDGSILFYNSTGTKVDEDNANLFWSNSRNQMGIGTVSPNTSLEVVGDVKVSASLEVGSTFKVDGKTIYNPSAVKDITAGGGVTAAMIVTKVIRIQGSGGDVTVTAEPAISAGTDGQIIILMGSNDSQTVKFNSGGSTGLKLSADTSFTLGSGDIMQMVYVTGLGWVEIGRTDN